MKLKTITLIIASAMAFGLAGCSAKPVSIEIAASQVQETGVTAEAATEATEAATAATVVVETPAVQENTVISNPDSAVSVSNADIVTSVESNNAADELETEDPALIIADFEAANNNTISYVESENSTDELETEDPALIIADFEAANGTMDIEFSENDAGPVNASEIPDSQMECIMNNQSVWEIEFSNGEDRYTVVDLDRDGLYEVLSYTWGGSANLSYSYLYEVNADLSGMTKVASWEPNMSGEGNSLAEVDWDSFKPMFIDFGDGTYGYIVSHVYKAGAAGSLLTNNLLCFTVDGTVGMTPISFLNISYDDEGNLISTYSDGNGAEISEDEYHYLTNSLLYGSDWTYLNIRWFNPLSNIDSFDSNSLLLNLEIAGSETHYGNN